MLVVVQTFFMASEIPSPSLFQMNQLVIATYKLTD
jgi:hypothetical protein